VDIERRTTEIVDCNVSSHSIYVAMTSVTSIGRFLAVAIELGTRDYPNEFHMASDRRTVSEILSWAEAVRECKCILSTTCQKSILIVTAREKRP
jgi:hypothetical protein